MNILISESQLTSIAIWQIIFIIGGILVTILYGNMLYKSIKEKEDTWTIFGNVGMFSWFLCLLIWVCVFCWNNKPIDVAIDNKINSYKEFSKPVKNPKFNVEFSTTDFKVQKIERIK